jgi:hypothetical protein
MPASVPPGGRPPSQPPSAEASSAAASSPRAPSPFDAVLAAEAPQRARGAASQPQQPREDADADAKHGASYTWLHYLILVVVAFVLGLLLWKLIDTERPSFSSAEPAAATVTTVAPGPWEGTL